MRTEAFSQSRFRRRIMLSGNMRSGAAMFTIEIVITRGKDQPEVIERMTSEATRLIDANNIAKSLLKTVRERHPGAMPDGYQILSHDGRILVRSWERKS